MNILIIFVLLIRGFWAVIGMIGMWSGCKYIGDNWVINFPVYLQVLVVLSFFLYIVFFFALPSTKELLEEWE